MNIDDLTVGELKKIAAIAGAFGGDDAPVDNGMVGKYVIVRCRDAGVHAGFLEWHNGRECGLKEARRLWYWKAANKSAFLSGVATEGLSKESKIGAPINVHLTENCEIIECTEKAAGSIQGMQSHEQS